MALYGQAWQTTRPYKFKRTKEIMYRQHNFKELYGLERRHA